MKERAVGPETRERTHAEHHETVAPDLQDACVPPCRIRAGRNAALFAAAPVAAQTANQLPQSQDGTLMNSIMGAIGIGGDTRPSIDYRERAPLVVPPSAANGELPQPQAPASAKLNNWPKDPDMARAEKANAVDNSPAQRYEDKRDVLLPSELNKGRKANAGKLDGPAQRYEDKRDVLSPSELGFKSWFGITPSDRSRWCSPASPPARA